MDESLTSNTTSFPSWTRIPNPLKQTSNQYTFIFQRKEKSFYIWQKLHSAYSRSLAFPCFLQPRERISAVTSTRRPYHDAAARFPRFHPRAPPAYHRRVLLRSGRKRRNCGPGSIIKELRKTRLSARELNCGYGERGRLRISGRSSGIEGCALSNNTPPARLQ